VSEPVRCLHCLDEGIVCEEHPDFPWEVKVEGHDGTALGHGAGMPCPYCCSPIPEDGLLHSIVEAFTPDWMREAVPAQSGVNPSRYL
jgi:hypothetical protein